MPTKIAVDATARAVGAAADWAYFDHVLEAGWIGLESDTGRFKVGDGESAWSGLAYVGESMNYAIKYDQDADPPTVAYLGKAATGSASSSAVWQVQKLTFGGDGDVTVTWADGNDSFDNKWDDRAILSYS